MKNKLTLLLEIFNQLTSMKATKSPYLSALAKPAMALAKNWLADKPEKELHQLLSAVNNLIPSILDDSVSQEDMLHKINEVVTSWQQQKTTK